MTSESNSQTETTIIWEVMQAPLALTKQKQNQNSMTTSQNQSNIIHNENTISEKERVQRARSLANENPIVSKSGWSLKYIVDQEFNTLWQLDEVDVTDENWDIDPKILLAVVNAKMKVLSWIQQTLWYDKPPMMIQIQNNQVAMDAWDLMV